MEQDIKNDEEMSDVEFYTYRVALWEERLDGVTKRAAKYKKWITFCKKELIKAKKVEKDERSTNT